MSSSNRKRKWSLFRDIAVIFLLILALTLVSVRIVFVLINEGIINRSTSAKEQPTLHTPLEVDCKKIRFDTRSAISISPELDELQFVITNNSDFDIILTNTILGWCTEESQYSDCARNVNFPLLKDVYINDEQIECSPKETAPSLGCYELISDISKRTVLSGNTIFLQLIPDGPHDSYGYSGTIRYDVDTECPDSSGELYIKQYP